MVVVCVFWGPMNGGGSAQLRRYFAEHFSGEGFSEWNEIGKCKRMVLVTWENEKSVYFKMEVKAAMTLGQRCNMKKKVGMKNSGYILKGD